MVDKAADGFLGLLSSKDMKRLSMRRRSAMIGGGKCNCGRCLKCIPSPSGEGERVGGCCVSGEGGGGGRERKTKGDSSLPPDWVWNGSKFVQVSTRDWKMVSKNLKCS